MKAFILRVATFGILLFAVLFFIKNSLPYSWGNSRITQKIEYTSNSPEKYDCLFFGSSRAFRHINLVLFDSITSLKSYNMGSPGAFFLETHYLIEHFLEKYPKNRPAKIFITERRISQRKKINFQTVRRKYYFDFKRLKMGLLEFWRRGESNKYEQVYRHLISYIENQLCIGELKAIKDFHLGNVKELSEFVLESQQGFYSLEQELKLTGKESLIKRNERYINSEIAKEDKPVSERAKKIIIEELSPEELNINTYGKQVEFFYINPIELEVEYHFDRTHFNDKGAEIYTRELANAVNELKE